MAQLPPGSEDVEEMFDVVNDANEVVRQEKRGVVHKLGLLHRSVHVLLFDSEGKVLMQQRSANKTVYPSAWDLSCAEHLQVGEGYEAAARRGLLEELGIVEPVSIVRVLPAVRHQVLIPAIGIRDIEFSELWALRFAGTIRPGVEVDALAWESWDELKQRVAACPAGTDPEGMTPWCAEVVRGVAHLDVDTLLQSA